MKKIIDAIKKIIKVIHKIEEYSLVIIFALMIIIAASQIVLRISTQIIDALKINFKMPVITWFDAFIKYSVLWIGLIAAGVATRAKKHINIDIIGRFAKGRLKNFIFYLTNFLSAVICIILSITSVFFIVKIQIPSQDPSPFLNIPKWILLLILPIGFGIIGLRFFFQSIVNIYNMIMKIDEKESEDTSSDFTVTDR